MGMSTHVIGFAPPDAKWQKMKDIWDACRDGGVEVPQEVQKFFGYDEPDAAGVEVKLDVRDWADGEREGFEIEVAKIPAHVKLIRFYNSW